MGTLTGNIPLLAEHCPHKLPTSCRLTATPRCCACQDKRPHSSSYRIYIDGIGFVARGTRWQNYCWFCKTYWDNRLADADGMTAAQTRIPESPSQDEFLQRWYEFHAAHRVEIDAETGLETKVPVEMPQLWADVAPGQLPRREGEDIRRERRASGWREQERSVEDAPHISIDDALDALLEDAEAEGRGDNETAPDTTSLSRIGLQHPPRQEPSTTISTATALDEADQRTSRARDTRDQKALDLETSTTLLDTLTAQLAAEQARHDQLAQDLRAAQRHLQEEQVERARIRREQRAAENFARLFGTREEMEQQGAAYTSPLTGMFNRAYERFNAAEADRQQERRRRAALSAEERAAEDERAEQEDYDNAFAQLINATQVEGQAMLQFGGPDDPYDVPLAELSVIDEVMANMSNRTTTFPLSDDELETIPEDAQVRSTLDEFSGLHLSYEAAAAYAALGPRPEPLPLDQLTLDCSCHVCYAQLAVIALAPCGHTCLCQWCAALLVPGKDGNETVPRHSRATCPLCRTRVNRRYRVYLGRDG